MNNEIISKIRKIKEKYNSKGFIILGIFGSYARNEETAKSDIDILYEMTQQFYDRYPGWDVFSVIEEIEKEIENSLGKKIDLTDLNALKKIGRKYILPEVQYV